MATREFYVVMLEMDDHLQTTNIVEQQIVAELVERLEEILLNDSKLDRTIKIGTLTSPMVCQAPQLFLKITEMYLLRTMKTC